MADQSGLIQPFDPSQVPDYLDAARKQMLASMLMQNTQRSLQTPQDWNSMRVVPRRSLLSNLASLGSAYAAGKAYPEALKAQAQYTTGLFNDPVPQSGQSAQPAAPPAPPMPPENIRAPGYMPPAPPSQPEAPQGPSLQNSMVPAGMSRPMAARLWMTLGPQGYAEKVMLPSQMGTPEWQTLMKATGGNADRAAQLILMKSQKEGYIAPLGGTRPGTIAFDPFTHQPLFAQPDVGHNVNLGVGPQGQVTAGPIPGNAGAQAQLAGAETGAKEANTVGTLPTAGGGSRPGWLGSLLGPPPSAQAPAMGIPPAARPQVPAAAPAAPSAPTPQAPASKSYFQGAQQSPSGPQGSPWSNVPKLPPDTSLGVNPLTKSVYEEAGKKHAELSNTYGTQADLADQKLQYNNEARKALASAEVGPSSEWLTENRARLKEWGVPEGLIPGSGTVTPTMELNKNLKQSALQGARAIFGSRMTQMEVRLQHEELSPSTSMTRDAISSLMQQDDIKQNYAKQRAEDYAKYFQQGGNPQRFESWYAKNYPLTRFASQQMTPPAAMDRLKQHPDLAKDFKERFGWLPYPGE
jgi:hypothetical protein